MDNMQMGGEMKVCKCPHHKMMPILLIVAGLVFLAGNMGWLSAYWVGIIWPLLLIIAGIKKLVMRMCKCC